MRGNLRKFRSLAVVFTLLTLRCNSRTLQKSYKKILRKDQASQTVVEKSKESEKVRCLLTFYLLLDIMRLVDRLYFIGIIIYAKE